MTVADTRAPGTPCRACRTPRPARMYLCRDCWFKVPAPARRLLNRRGPAALDRLRELHAHIDAGHPLPTLEITA